MAATKRAVRSLEIEAFDERQFYLEEFRDHTLLLALTDADLSEGREHELAALARTLIANATQLIILIDVSNNDDVELARRAIKRRLQRLVLVQETLSLFRDANRPTNHFVTVDPNAFEGSTSTNALLAQIWTVLRQGPLFVGIAAHRDRDAGVEFAARLGALLRVQKLVVTEPEGGLVGGDGKRISFMDEQTMAALLTAGEAESIGLGARKHSVACLRQAILEGANSANLCSLSETARELFTYEGSGTLFTLEDYCRVERLGIDDFDEAELLIQRGEREGVLKPRRPDEVAALLACSYGATIGAHHLAGICALITESYEREHAGEIVGLYTITRFKGEGVGVRLVEQTIAAARQRRLAYVFATTTVDRAQHFFERCGFRVVKPSQVPPSKWQGYDPQRKAQAVLLRLDL